MKPVQSRSGRRIHAVAPILAITFAISVGCAPAPAPPVPTPPAAASGLAALNKTAFLPVEKSAPVAASAFQEFALQMKGTATLQGRLVGAKVRLVTLDGAPLFEAPAATSAGGSFHFPVPANLPSSFRVEVTGGTHRNQPFNGTLSAEFQDFSRHRPVAVVNAATTLAAAYRQAKGVQPKEARAAVARYLGLPAMADLGSHLNNPYVHQLDHALLASSVVSQPDVDAAMKAQVGLVDGAPASTVKFGPKAYKVQALDAVDELMTTSFSDLALNAAKVAGTSAIGSAVGWAISSIFGSSDSKQLDQIQNQLNKVQGELNVVNDRLNQLDSRVLALQSAMYEIEGQVSQLEQQMNRDFGRSEYDSFADAVSNSTSVIDGYYEQLQLYISDAAQADKSDMDTLRQAILLNVPAAMDHIHKAQVGLPGSTPGLVRWFNIVGNGDPNYPNLADASFFNKLNMQYDYFRGEQFKAALLLVEAYHASQPSPNTTAAVGITNQVNANLALQLQQLFGNGQVVTRDQLVSPWAGLMYSLQPLASDSGTTSPTWPAAATLPATVRPPFSSPPLFAETDWVVQPIALPTWLSGQLSSFKAAGHTDWRLPAAVEFRPFANKPVPQPGFNTDSKSFGVLVSDMMSINGVPQHSFLFRPIDVLPRVTGSAVTYQIFPVRPFPVDPKALALLGIDPQWRKNAPDYSTFNDVLPPHFSGIGI